MTAGPDSAGAAGATATPSATVPDWSREAKPLWAWDPSRSLLASLRAHQRRRGSGRLLDVVLRHADGNQSKAAEWLGINRNTLRRKLLEHKLVDQ